MNDVNLNINSHNLPPIKGEELSPDIQNLEAQISKQMKVKRPKVSANNIKTMLPAQKTFSDREATKRIQAINIDIYEGAAKEKEKHEFNFKRYFTIFGIFALLAAAVSYFRKRK